MAAERKSLVPSLLIGGGIIAAIAYAVTRPKNTAIGKVVGQVQSAVGKAAGQVQTAIDKLNPSLTRRYLALQSMIRDAAAGAGIPPEVLAGTLRAETSYNNAIRGVNSGACANVPCVCTGNHPDVGFGQISVDAARQVGFTGTPTDLCDPATNLKYVALFLAKLAKYYADPSSRLPGDDVWTAVRKSYNAGQGAYNKGNIHTATVLYAARAQAAQDDLKNRGLAGLAGAFPVRRSFRWI